MTPNDQISLLIDENERIKSTISWIEWYQTGRNAQNEIDMLESEILFLRQRIKSVVANRDDFRTIPALQERAKFVVAKIVEIETAERKRISDLCQGFHVAAKDNPRRIAGMSEEKSLEFATNVGMTVEDLQKILKAGTK